MSTAIIVMIFLAGVLLGTFIGLFLFCHTLDGALTIQHKSDDTDQYSLDFTTGLDDIPKKRFVIFRVKKID